MGGDAAVTHAVCTAFLNERKHKNTHARRNHVVDSPTLPPAPLFFEKNKQIENRDRKKRKRKRKKGEREERITDDTGDCMWL